ncbi:GDSL-type esterase/lipase family protein [Rhodococcoides kyotonense]|uniref:Lysophospholipase L1 n=1 Tax=Rhodococcoides kyotonense TaxID=398843 RepID=A0A239FR98_9NOCA|nr:GDSL-type esterase/lipase family protein [Rhodococcus kyotonensis]SNS58414.1 Lysophospholipase L1 [Rhodococcus kyotonensis]
MTSPTPPANGDTVPLIGVITTVYLKAGEVANVIWSPFYTTYVERGYASIYTGSITPTPVYRSFSDQAVADLVGTETAKTRLALEVLIESFGGGGGGGLTDAQIAALVTASSSSLKTALDQHYAPVSLAPGGSAGQVLAKTADGVAWTAQAAGSDPAEIPRRILTKALAQRGTQIVNTGIMGASVAAGHNSTPRWRKFWNLLGEAFHAQYNPVGIAGGFHSLLTELNSWAFTGTTSQVRRGFGTGSVAFSAGATASLSPAVTTGFTVYYAQGPGQGPFKIKLDNGADVTVTPDTSGALRYDGVWSSQALVRQGHTIKITAVGACEINSVYVIDQDHNVGVRFMCGALGGNLSADFLNSTYAPTHWAQVAALAPKMLAVHVGSNDHNAGVPVATYKANLEAILTQIETTLGYRPWVPIIAQNPRTGDFLTPVAPWSAYVQAMKEVAAAHPTWVSFHDYGPLFPQVEADGDGGGILSTDKVHPTTLGHEVIFMELARQFGVPARSNTAVTPPVGIPIVPGTSSSVTPVSVTRGLVSRFSAKSFADYGIADGTAVAEWPVEQGSSLVPMSQATEARRPVYRATGAPGGQPAVQLDAALTQSMASAAWASGVDTPLTIIAVFSPTATPASSQTIVSGMAATRYIALQNSNDNRIAVLPGATTGTLRSAPSTVVASTMYAVAGKVDGASSSLHINKKSATVTGTLVTTAENAVAGLSGVSIGRAASSATTGNMSGYVSEVLVYNVALTQTEIDTIMTELGTAYSLAIAA